jgi:hypothetical protein
MEIFVYSRKWLTVSERNSWEIPWQIQVWTSYIVLRHKNPENTNRINGNKP